MAAHHEMQPFVAEPASEPATLGTVDDRLAACQRELAALKDACDTAQRAGMAREADTQAALRSLRAILRAWNDRRSTRVLLELAAARQRAFPYGSVRGQLAGYAVSAASVTVGEAVHAAKALLGGSAKSESPARLIQDAGAAWDDQLMIACRSPEALSVSVIVPVYNASRANGAYLVEALESIAAQDPLPHEVIVVDDGSTDGSSGIVEGFIATHPQMEVRLVCKRNGGQSSARNWGADLARGEWLAFLDQDDVWLASHLRTIAPYLTSDVDLVYTDADMVDENGELIMPSIHARYGFGGRHPKACLDDVLYEDICVMPGVMTIRRSTFMHIGGFDERLSGCEDDDLFVRALLAGPVRYLPVPTLRWRMYAQSYGQSDRMIRSRLLYWRKLLRHYSQATVHQGGPRRMSLRFVFIFLSECSRRLDEGAPLTSEYLDAALEVLSTLGPADRTCFTLAAWAFRRRGHRAALARYWFLRGMEPARPQPPLDFDPQGALAG
jgi:GT2 family glycosyltransferase